MSKVSLSSKGVCMTPVWVIGTYGKDGKPNASTAAWVGMCCSILFWSAWRLPKLLQTQVARVSEG